MALIKCPECGKDISNKSSACIHCGYPIEKLQQESSNTEQPQSTIEVEIKVDDASLGFTLFSVDDNNVNLECNKCSKVYKYNKKVNFSEVSDKKCISNNDICCPSCGNTVPVGAEIIPRQSTKHNDELKQNSLNTTKTDDNSGMGCLIYLIFIGVIIIGGIWFIVDSFDGFVLSVILPFVLAVLVVGFVLYAFVTSDKKEMKEGWDKEKYSDYKFTCPMCGSKKVKKISNINRASSVAMLGAASSKIGKQYECDACKHKW